MASAAAIAGLSPDLVSDVQQLTAFPFMVNALEAGTIVAVIAGVVGWFMVLRRETFAGHTLSVMAFPGATGALLIGLSAAAGYFGFCGALRRCVIGVAGSRGAGRRTAAGVGGHGHGAGVRAGLRVPVPQPLPGRARQLREPAVRQLPRHHPRAGAGARDRRILALGLFALIGRPLLFASVDERVARRAACRTRAVAGFLLVLGLAVAETAQITGALLVFALLVAPPATAQLITPRIGASLAAERDHRRG